MAGDDPRSEAISAELVHSLVAEQFPQWAQLPIAAARRQGIDNRTFRLGPDLSVRLPSAQPYAAAVAKEDRVLPLLARHVPVAIPEIVATGRPSAAFPRAWSVRRWLTGDVPDDAPTVDRERLADDLAGFLVALRRVPPDQGPPCGAQSFFRGCHPSVYADEVEQALLELGEAVDRSACRAVWAAAVRSAWAGPPVWFHGDLAEGNILIRDARLGAVIDFGACGVGDPACDLVIAWTFMTRRERIAFRAATQLDADTWARARGWALWKALITLREPASPLYHAQQRALREVISECRSPR